MGSSTPAAEPRAMAVIWTARLAPSQAGVSISLVVVNFGFEFRLDVIRQAL